MFTVISQQNFRWIGIASLVEMLAIPCVKCFRCISISAAINVGNAKHGGRKGSPQDGNEHPFLHLSLMFQGSEGKDTKKFLILCVHPTILLRLFLILSYSPNYSLAVFTLFIGYRHARCIRNHFSPCDSSYRLSGTPYCAHCSCG